MENNKSGVSNQPLKFGTYVGDPPKFKKKISQSVYLPMRDGVKIALEVILPGDLPEGEKIPALLMQTRYWRAARLRAPFRWLLDPDLLIPKDKNPFNFFVSRGYAMVIADVRGTGASFGVHPYPWSDPMIEDMREIVDWIIRHSWSNGNVGTFGCSFAGMTAELTATINHPAVKIVMPQFSHPDPYMDISHPGGVFNERFVRDWHIYDEALDRNQFPESAGAARLLVDGVKPVDEDRGGKLLQAASQEHKLNGNVYDLAEKTIFRDDLDPKTGFQMDRISVHRHKSEMEKSEAAIDSWGSWMDAGTADAVLRRFLTFKNAKRGVIGAWSHDGYYNASQYLSGNGPNPPYPLQLAEMLRAFEGCLKGLDSELPQGKVLFYYTMGEEKWKMTPVWPPEGTEIERWYFQKNQGLGQQTPIDDEGSDSYMVSNRTTTGPYNVWWEMGVTLGKTVMIPNRTEQVAHLLHFTSAQLTDDVEISGYPVITLYAASTETDGNFFVYLEDVDEQGNTTYITEGQLRAIHRKVSTETPPYNLQVPYHTFKKADAMPLVPGEVAELKFGLRPTSVLIRKNHRIRVSIAGHDEGTFTKVPADRDPCLTFMRFGAYSSCIDLPILRKK